MSDSATNWPGVALMADRGPENTADRRRLARAVTDCGQATVVWWRADSARLLCGDCIPTSPAPRVGGAVTLRLPPSVGSNQFCVVNVHEARIVPPLSFSFTPEFALWKADSLKLNMNNAHYPYKTKQFGRCRRATLLRMANREPAHCAHVRRCRCDAYWLNSRKRAARTVFIADEIFRRGKINVFSLRWSDPPCRA